VTDTATPFDAIIPRLFEDDPTPFGKQYRPRYTPRRCRVDDTITTYLDEILADADSRTPASTDVFADRLAAPASGPGEPDNALRDRAVTAIDDLRTVLGLADSSAAKLADVARNTLASWRRRERAPYPATVRHLFEVHSVVAAAAALLGHDGARSWFHSPMTDGVLRLDALAAADGPTRLAGELRSQLFLLRHAPGLPDDFDDEEAGIDDVYSAKHFASQPRARPKVL